MTPTIPPEAVLAFLDNDPGMATWRSAPIDRQLAILSNTYAGLDAALPHLVGWRDISSAPRNGSWFWATKHGQAIPFVTSHDGDDEGEFFTFNLAYEHSPGFRERRKWEPTLWMPMIPPPPAGSEGS
jgi:hypothetical protein